MKIRWRLTWYGIGFTALSLAAFLLALSLLVAGSGVQDQDELLSVLADDAATALSAGSIGTEGTELPSDLPDASTSDTPFTTVYDTVGTVVYATGTVDGAPLELPAAVIVETTESGASEISVHGVRVQARRWSTADGATGVVAAAQSLRVAAAQLVGLRWILVIFGVIALLAAGIGAWFMSGRALRPLHALAATTDDIGDTGDLSRRLPSVDQEDEVGTLTASFNAMLDGLEQAQADRDMTIDAQKRFIADASHELRSPLTSIRANAGFLVEQQEASAKDRNDAIGDIATEAERMSALIDSLLDLARSDAGFANRDDLLPVDLGPLAFSVQRRARNLALTLDLEVDDDVVVDGDYSQLAELLWILVDNADRHGGANATLIVQRGDAVGRLRLTDDGPGIGTEHIGKVFDRFHRADPARSGQGYGLGLALAKSIVERHGGTISARNGATGGVEFLVDLPLSAIHAAGPDEKA